VKSLSLSLSFFKRNNKKNPKKTKKKLRPEILAAFFKVGEISHYKK
jgi:hypothetical protein